MIDAFVAFGGLPHKKGCAKRDTLLKIIKHDFVLTIDIEELINKIDSNGSREIEFEESRHSYHRIRFSSQTFMLLYVSIYFNSNIIVGINNHFIINIYNSIIHLRTFCNLSCYSHPSHYYKRHKRTNSSVLMLRLACEVHRNHFNIINSAIILIQVMKH